MSADGIVAVGDSITNACSADLVVDGIPPLSWVEWVALSTSMRLTKYVSPGSASRQIRELLPTSDEHYSLGLVYVGVNNIISWRRWRTDDLESDLRSILEHISSRADRVAIMQYPLSLGQASAFLPYGPFLKRRIRTARKMLARAANDTGATIIDPPDMTVNERIWIDGVHPTSAGHHALGQATLNKLQLPDVNDVSKVQPRGDFVAWRRKQRTKFRLSQPVRGLGTWLIGR
jgi:lysophospholipase L1-like esterase